MGKYVYDCGMYNDYIIIIHFTAHGHTCNCELAHVELKGNVATYNHKVLYLDYKNQGS